VSTVVGGCDELKDVVQTLWTAAVGAGTRRVYNTGFGTLSRFLIMSGMATVCGLQFPPLCEEVLIFFVAHCFDVLKLSYATIKMYLYGIRHAYIGAGHGNPLCDKYGQPLHKLHLILKGVKKTQHRRIKPRLPVTFDILFEMCSLLKQGVYGPYVDLLMQTMCSVAFFGFLRCGEFTCLSQFDPAVHLTVKDVQYVSEQAIFVVNIKASKTDPFRQGVSIKLCSTGGVVCPVQILSRYVQCRHSMGARDHSPLFVDSTGRPITRSFFIKHLKEILSKLGHKSANYSGHSMRIGAATTAAQCQIADHLIKTLGRWSSGSYC
jgi:hypothetical protein